MKAWIAALALLASSPAAATVRYAIDLTAPDHHSGNVTVTFPRTAGPYLDVKMAAWRTGRYSILNLANGVSRFNARDSAGQPLRWQKVDKSTWRIALARPTEVKVTYELYGNELGLRSRHIDDSHAYLDASATFLYADRYRTDDVTVALSVPRKWQSFSGLRSTGAHRFVAPNWDVLVDSPIETGIEKSARFSEGGRDYEISFWGDRGFAIEQMAADLRKIVRQAPAIWPTYPFKRYVFFVHATDTAGGATEHLNSTVIQMPRATLRTPAGYRTFLATSAHEFVHTWNVKAYRPAGLVPYDYDRENYSDLLWMAEGSTEYFSNQMMVWSGLASTADYLAEISNEIDANRHRPGRLVQSVAEASFNEWISPADADRSKNAWVGIYTEGQLASLALDLALLRDTGGRVSYRDVHRLLHERFDSRVRGFTNADVLAILRELTGRSWEQWWAATIMAPVDHDYDAMFAPVGLRLEPGTGTRAVAGWMLRPGDSGITIGALERDGPAWRAGLVAGDRIVSIDGAPATVETIQALGAAKRPGDRARVRVARRDEELEKIVTFASGPLATPKLVPVANPTAAQKAMFESWLRVPYPAA